MIHALGEKASVVAALVITAAMLVASSNAQDETTDFNGVVLFVSSRSDYTSASADFLTSLRRE